MEVSKLPDLPLRRRVVFSLLLFHSRNLILGHKVSSYYKHTYVPQNDINLLPKKLWLANPLKNPNKNFIQDNFFLLLGMCMSGFKIWMLEGFQRTANLSGFFFSLDGQSRKILHVYLNSHTLKEACYDSIKPVMEPYVKTCWCPCWLWTVSYMQILTYEYWLDGTSLCGKI